MKNGRKIITRRKFSDDFKKTIVKEYESGQFTVTELGKLHKIANKVIYKWIYKYSNYNQPNTVIVEMKDSSTQKLKDYEIRIKKLERIVGQKQIEIDYLSKVIEIADKHYQTDLKKNSKSKL